MTLFDRDTTMWISGIWGCQKSKHCENRL